MSKIKVLLLGDLNSAHFIKWINGLKQKDQELDISVYTFCRKQEISDRIEDVRIFYGRSDNRFLNSSEEGSISKLLLYFQLPEVLSVIKRVKPDIIHSHYATGYGLLGALTFFHPFLVSVWGSDVLTFPHLSPIHKTLLKFVLGKADHIFATSNYLCEEARKYSSGKISVIPFGINLNKFKKTDNSKDSLDDEIVIGTIKSLKQVYGIDILIKVFADLRKRNPSKNLRLFIAGEGPEEADLKKLTNELNIREYVNFAGRIPYDEVPAAHNRINIFANLSRSESFGVSVLEASACGVPLVASDIGGLKEVVIHGKTGYLVNINNISEITESFERLVRDKELSRKMGQNGRNMVEGKFDWEMNIFTMIKYYNKYAAYRNSSTSS